MDDSRIKTLLTINNLFESQSIRWVLSGSTNLALQGIDVTPGDIDILIASEDVSIVQELFEPYCIQPITHSWTDQFRSHYGKFEIDGFDVEIMADVEIFCDGKWCITQRYERPIERINLRNIQIRCASLESEYQAYIQMGRAHKAALIKKVLDKKENEDFVLSESLLPITLHLEK